MNRIAVDPTLAWPSAAEAKTVLRLLRWLCEGEYDGLYDSYSYLHVTICARARELIHNLARKE